LEGVKGKGRIVRAESGGGKAVREAAEVLLAGGLVAYPTESFYGLGADAANEEAVNRIFIAKKRREDRPLLILIPSREALGRYVKGIPPLALELMDTFWPGGLTLILEAAPDLSPLLTAGSGKIGVRLSSHPLATALALAVGGAVTGTSANLSDRPPCRTPEEVIGQIGEELDLILDGGRTEGASGSTLLDLTVDPPEILREGLISRTALAPFLHR
jgi:L-threonylcarbamoyladenylate synthase